MNRLDINPNNEKYYSKEFMQGYKCGTRCQFDEDMKVLEQIENDINHEISDIDESDFRRGVNIGLCHAIQHVRKYR